MGLGEVGMVMEERFSRTVRFCGNLDNTHARQGLASAPH